MAVTMVERKMLYCPKCNATYQEGTQRFCITCGSRLVSATTAKASLQSPGVFTSLLGRASSKSENDERIVPKPSRPQNTPPVFNTPFAGKVFQGHEDLTVKKERPAQVPIPTQQPAVRLVKPDEIASGTAEVGDRAKNPTGRLALTWENPRVLLGQTIKGRYYVVEKLDQDETSILYLAEDKIIPEKQVVVRVLMEEKKDPFLSKIFAEERVSLSHINHPNIVGVLDSGELLEGMPFLVSERVDGFSLYEKLQKLEQFNPLRTARIARQASYALSEVHQNGILHRSLKPSSIFLTVSEVGSEQVKVADFVVSNGGKKQNLASAKYLSPEQLEGKMPNFASDIYSLAVIAYQMLTGSMPFDFDSADQLLKAQRDGLFIRPSKLREEISADVDAVFEKALAYNATDRYPKARDFGDALFNALSLSPDPENAIQIEGVELREGKKPDLVGSSIRIPSLREARTAEANQITIQAKKAEDIRESEITKISVPKRNEKAWEKRSPERNETFSPFWMFVGTLGLLILGFLAWQSWSYFQNQNDQPQFPVAQSTPLAPDQIKPTDPQSEPNTIDETPPPLRDIAQPENTEYFENTKAEQKGKVDALKNYRGFRVYYPTSWTKNNVKKGNPTPFLDISKKNANGTMVEQFLVTHYNSTGLYSKDLELFPQLVEKSNKDLREGMGGDFNYKIISQGEATIQEGRWKVYQVVFQFSDIRPDGQELKLWGRRFWLPPQNKSFRNGLVITMLATSASPDITSAEQVGNSGDLAMILATFEPSQND